jgi:hypothetical protein
MPGDLSDEDATIVEFLSQILALALAIRGPETPD